MRGRFKVQGAGAAGNVGRLCVHLLRLGGGGLRPAEEALDVLDAAGKLGRAGVLAEGDEKRRGGVRWGCRQR